ncbi:MAG: hypothetical protein VBE63_19860 [Lamprobacter sp.]|nr:hypothetical protein [Lamprobacter sp.]MEA3642173.1 hypothetical protein [Lamprobacter sp.]
MIIVVGCGETPQQSALIADVAERMIRVIPSRQRKQARSGAPQVMH